MIDNAICVYSTRDTRKIYGLAIYKQSHAFGSLNNALTTTWSNINPHYLQVFLLKAKCLNVATKRQARQQKMLRQGHLTKANMQWEKKYCF